MLYIGLATLILSMWVTWATVPLVIRGAQFLGALDLPSGRKTHIAPMPRIGGVAVFTGFIAGLLFAALLVGADTVLLFSQRLEVYWRGLIVAATGIFLVGLMDDLWHLSYRWKFAAQLLAAAFVWYCGFRIEIVSNPLGGELQLGALALPVTLLWIVGITNAVNLIDGLDGLAAGVALITTVSVAVIAFFRAELGVTAASVALAGSLIGFLRFNLNPARIFLGDCGSMFLGFVLAVTSVRGSQKGPTAVAILAPLLILGLPLLDTGLAVLRRLYRVGTDPRRTDRWLSHLLSNLNHVFLPDRGHIHHRLIDLGVGHRAAVWILYGVASVFALAAFALVLVKSVFIGLLLLGVLALALVAFGTALYLRLWRASHPAPDHRIAEESPAMVKSLASSGGRSGPP